MKYIAKKFGSLLLTLLLVSFLSFFAFSVIPGDAAKSQLGTEATPERIEALQKEMGLDRPVLERYASWVTGFFHGDLGTSYSYSMPVGELIRDKVPITIAITVIAFLMILVVSIPIGIFTAQHAGGPADHDEQSGDHVCTGIFHRYSDHVSFRSDSQMVSAGRLCADF